MQRGMNDNVEPDRSNKSPDTDDREHLDDPTEHPIGVEDEEEPLRVNRTDDTGLTGKDAPDALTETDDVVDDDDDVLEPIDEAEAG